MSDEPTKNLPLVFDEPRGRKKPPRHLADLTPAERKTLVTEMGLPGFRAKQLSTHYFSRLVDDPAEMTDLPAAERESLVAALLPDLMTPIHTMEADKGTTRKTLWKLFDGVLVESVLMRYPGRVTMCVSSQAGCGMACPFCATGQGGLQRNMSTAEIVEQVVAGARSLSLGDVLNSYGDWGWVHVNLIPLNPTPGSKWTASRPEDEREFVRRLEAKGIPTTVRDTRGREIDGACGQLAAAE